MEIWARLPPVADLLRDKGGFPGVQVESVSQDRHEVYRVAMGTAAFALKVFGDGAAARAERRGLHLSRAEVCVPQLVSFGRIDGGRNYVLTTWCDGETLSSVLRRGSAATCRSGIAAAATTLGHLHRLGSTVSGVVQVNASLRGFGSGGFRDAYFAELDGFRRNAGADLCNEVYKALGSVRKLDAAERGVVLTHGDYQPKNVIVGSAGDVRAVIDWEFFCLAQCWADLAHILRASEGDTMDILIGSSYGGLPDDWIAIARAYDLARICVGLDRAEWDGDDIDDWVSMVGALAQTLLTDDAQPARIAARKLRLHEA